MPDGSSAHAATLAALDEQRQFLERQRAELEEHTAALFAQQEEMIVQAAELRAARDYASAILAGTRDGVAAFDGDRRLTAWNAAMERLTGLPPAAAIGRPVEACVPGGPDAAPDGAAPDGAAPYDAALRGETVTRPGVRVPAGVAGERIVDVTCSPLRAAYGDAELAADAAVVGGICVVHDVTAERTAAAALAAREAELRALFAAMRDAVFVLDADGTYVRVVTTASSAPAAAPAPAAPGVREALPPDAADRVLATLRQVLATGAPAEAEYALTSPDGRVDLLATASPVGDGTVLWVARDVTAQRRAEEALRELSTRDELTGLLNRRGLRPLAEQSLAIGRRTGRRDAVLYVDLDAFKPINDTYGHAAGDEALRAVARVLRERVRAEDLVARLGGDEFAVFAVGLAHPGEGRVLADRLAAAMAADCARATAGGRPWSIGFSVGVAESEPGDDLDALLARADAALYAVKHGRGARRRD